MKLSQKTTDRIAVVGVVAMLGPAVASMYYLGKTMYTMSNSSYHDRLREINRELPVLKHEIAECMPETMTLPSQECLDVKVRYETLKQEAKEVENSESYKAVEVQIGNSIYNSLYSVGFSIPGMVLLVAGAVYTSKRSKEMDKDIQKLKKEVGQQ